METHFHFTIQKHQIFWNLNHDESGRFTVKNTNEEGTCFLQLSIDPAKRLDGGTYISPGIP